MNRKRNKNNSKDQRRSRDTKWVVLARTIRSL